MRFVSASSVFVANAGATGLPARSVKWDFGA